MLNVVFYHINQALKLDRNSRWVQITDPLNKIRNYVLTIDASCYQILTLSEQNTLYYKI